MKSVSHENKKVLKKLESIFLGAEGATSKFEQF